MGIIIAAAVILLILWAAACRRRLTVMEENVDHAMAQLSVQLSSRFDALTALLDLTKSCDAREAQTLIETVKSRRSVITAASAPDDVLKQEEIISEVLRRVCLVAEKYPELKTSEKYAKYMNAVDSCEKMVCTSRLIYNDSVTKLNRELRMFPACLVGGLFGIRQRDYLEAAEESARAMTETDSGGTGKS